MKTINRKIFFATIYLIISCFIHLPLKAQVPIEDLLNKYKDLDKLQTFNLSEEQLEVAKQMSYNLNTEQKNLILQTNEQYTLTYTGNNPSLINFFDEAISIIDTKDYKLANNFEMPYLRRTMYARVENDSIKEIIKLIRTSNSIVITVSKGNFDKAGYPGLNQSDNTQDHK